MTEKQGLHNYIQVFIRKVVPVSGDVAQLLGCLSSRQEALDCIPRVAHPKCGQACLPSHHSAGRGRVLKVILNKGQFEAATDKVGMGWGFAGGGGMARGLIKNDQCSLETRVWFPAHVLDDSQPPLTLAPGDQSLLVHTHTHARLHAHTHII